MKWLVLLYSCPTTSVWLKQRKYQPYTLLSIQLVLVFKFIATSAEIQVQKNMLQKKASGSSEIYETALATKS
jgi:hypothetical protein